MEEKPNTGRFERDIWLYQGQVGRIFRAGEEIPPKSEGWLDHQTVEPDPFDHDGDGKPGGSVRRKPGRPRKVTDDDA